MNTITYDLGDATYVNLTNRCTNRCSFCVRDRANGVGGYDLRLHREPEGREVISAIAEKMPRQVVFCGFGEPTLRLDELIEAARFVRSYGGHVRVNTNGHALLVHGRDVIPELAEVVDEVSVSLNAADRDKYAELTGCSYGPAGFDALLSFAASCRDAGIKVTLSIVDVLDEEETEAAAELAKEMGVEFRVRAFVP